MSGTHDIVAMMSRGWNQPPAGVVMAPDNAVARAALWTVRGGSRGIEVHAEPMEEHHLVGVPLKPSAAEIFLDGRKAFGPLLPAKAVQMVQAGQRPGAVLRGDSAFLHIYLPVHSVRRVVEDLEAPALGFELRDPAFAKDPVLTRLADEVLAEMRSGERTSRLRVDLLTQDIAIQLVRRWSNVETRRPSERGGLAPWQVRRVTDYLEADLARNVTLAELSAIAELSSCHFCRAFKQSLGLAPHQWLRARRMEKARELLETTDLPVIEVGALVGLENPSAFATAFRRHVGASPSAYRRDRRW